MLYFRETICPVEEVALEGPKSSLPVPTRRSSRRQSQAPHGSVWPEDMTQ